MHTLEQDKSVKKHTLYVGHTTNETSVPSTAASKTFYTSGKEEQALHEKQGEGGYRFFVVSDKQCCALNSSVIVRYVNKLYGTIFACVVTTYFVGVSDVPSVVLFRRCRLFD